VIEPVWNDKLKRTGTITEMDSVLTTREKASRQTTLELEKFKLKLDSPSMRIEMARESAEELLRRQVFTCTAPYAPELLSCSERFYFFNFNTDNGRFVYFRGYGYVAGDHDSIKVSYGKCDKF